MILYEQTAISRLILESLRAFLYLFPIPNRPNHSQSKNVSSGVDLAAQ